MQNGFAGQMNGIVPHSSDGSELQNANNELVHQDVVGNFVCENRIQQCECVAWNITQTDRKCVRHSLEYKFHRETTGSTIHGGIIPGMIRTDECRTQMELVNKYGKLKFGNEDSPAKPFIRIAWEDKETNRDLAHVPDPSVIFNPLSTRSTLFDLWNVRNPKLVISMFGLDSLDLSDFIPNKYMAAFKECIDNLLKTPGTLILTDGSCPLREEGRGIADCVGKTTERLDSKAKEHALAVGIAHWGTTCHDPSATEAGELLKDQGRRKRIFEYTVPQNKKEKMSLQSVHTHFILVDDGKYRFREEGDAALDFMIEFVRKIREMESHTIDDQALTVPYSVSLVFGGGPRTLKTVLKIIKKGLPIVVIEGSKGAADIIANAYRIMKNSMKSSYVVHSDGIEIKLKRALKLKGMKPWLRKVDLKKVIESMKPHSSSEQTPQIHICGADDLNKEQKGLNAAILRAAIGASDSPDDEEDTNNFGREEDDSFDDVILRQVDLALALNQSKVAKESILEKLWLLKQRPDTQTTPEDKYMKNRHQQLEDALVDNKPNFVQLFLEAKYNYCDINRFLENDRNIGDLYKKMFEINDDMVNLITTASKTEQFGCRECLFVDCISRDVSCLDTHSTGVSFLPMVGDAISKLVGPFYKRMYGGGSHVQYGNCCCCPSNRSKTTTEVADIGLQVNDSIDIDMQLFLWSVLFNREKMAELFWRRSSKPHIMTALFASTMLAQLARIANSENEPDLAESISKHARLFEDRANDVLTECTAGDRNKTQKLLTREHGFMGEGSTLLSLAYDGEMRHFLSHTSCRVKIDDIWKGKMVWSTVWWKILLTVVCPFFLPCINFTESRSVSEVFAIDLCLCRSRKIVDVGQAQIQRRKSSYRVRCRPKQEHSPPGPRGKQQDNGIHWFSAYLFFLTAPITKFYYYTLSYLIFLALFSFVCLTELKPERLSLTEFVVWIWIALFIVEEGRQICRAGRQSSSITLRQKFGIWFKEHWNKFDLTLHIFSFVCLFMRFIPPEDFHHVRNAFAITLACYYFRFLQTYYAVPDIGPKVMTIFHMLRDLLKFGFILFVFIISYGVASTIILYPNQPPTWDLLSLVIYSPYWQMFVRDAFVDIVDGEPDDDDCTRNRSVWMNNKHIPQCPEVNSIAKALLVIYTMITNVLLLNLLIAMFTSTFERFQSESNLWWHFNRYSLVREYAERPTLPPPLIAISYLVQVVRWILYKCLCLSIEDRSERTQISSLYTKLGAENGSLDRFERVNMEKAMERREKRLEHMEWLEATGITPGPDPTDNYNDRERITRQKWATRDWAQQ